MKNTKKLLTTSFLAILTVAIATPLIAVMPASAAEETETSTKLINGIWYIQNDLITIAFPANGTKPMFLWWYTKDPSNINVVKFKGLIEYSTYEVPYFLWRCQAEAWRIAERLQMRYYMSGMKMLQKMNNLEKALGLLGNIRDYIGLHSPYLPFSNSNWRLDGPANVTEGTVKYLSFNFTLIDIPAHPNLQFAENNVMFRCRFYYTPATEDVYGKYQYTVKAGELKVDIVINHWEWNIDKLQPIIENLRELGLNIPDRKPSLALWVNLASINLTETANAKEDVQSSADTNTTEKVSMSQNMYVEGSKVSVVQDNTGSDEQPLQNRWRERFNIRLETGNATFAGFFKFVPQAIVTNGVTYNTTDVTASYISAGRHMQLFIGYPYFGNNTLIHDPSLGVESIAPWLPTSLLMVLIGSTIAIAVAVVAVKLRKKPVNIINVQ